MLTLLYIKTNVNISGNDNYYPLWIAYLVCYYVFYAKSNTHLLKIQKEKQEEETVFNLSGLDKLFEPKALNVLKQNQSQVIAILSYFATSLFDKNKTKEVLWDILENCVSKLQLEDCVLYLLDEKSQVLHQEAAFGDKKQDVFEIHGMEKKAAQAFIHISLTQEETKFHFQIVNHNDRSQQKSNSEHSGVGLENVRHNLDIVYPNKHTFQINETNETFTVSLHINENE